MDDMTALDRLLTSEVQREAGPSQPVNDAAIFTAITATPSPKWRFQSMFSATKFVVAGAIVALFGGFLLAGLLAQPSDDRPPVVGASASATAQAEPTDAATSEPDRTTGIDADGTTIIPDLLPGADLVTEEVEPGVYRVVSDGVRDLVRPVGRLTRYGGALDGSIVAGLDGSVWWFDRDGFARLGEEAIHDWPSGLTGNFRPGRADIEVGPDGTVWLAARFASERDGISSYDGQAWSNRWRGDAQQPQSYGVEVQQDGTVTMAWFMTTSTGGYGGLVRTARFGEDDWAVLPGSIETAEDRPPALGGEVVVVEGGGSDVWVRAGMSERLRRYDGEDWVVVQTPEAGGEQRIAVGPDGTLWVRLHPECGPGTEGDQPIGACAGPSDILARFDGNEWEVYDSSDGIPMMGDHYQGFDGFFAAAPDGSVWFNPMNDYERTGTECDGIANFDGEDLTYFLRDACIYAMDLAPDGTVWLQAGGHEADVASGEGLGDARPGPAQTYVITPEAVAE